MLCIWDMLDLPRSLVYELGWQVLQVGAPVDRSSGLSDWVSDPRTSDSERRQRQGAGARAFSVRIRTRMALEPGDKAPDFTLPDQHGNPVALSEFRGNTVVLYFYPKADTPGCTTQACGVRDHRADYANASTVVLGVSPDAVKPIAKFDEKYGDFPLLSDEDHAVAEAYGVWVEKNRYGRTYMGNERTTFVIGEDGTIREVFRSVKPAEHDELVLGA
jgi:thioredoxin-dependent peroxiredoxin